MSLYKDCLGRKNKEQRREGDKDGEELKSTNKYASSFCVSRWLTTKIKQFFLEMEPCWTKGIPEDNVLDSTPCTITLRPGYFETQTSGYRPLSVLNSDSNLASTRFIESWWMCSIFLMNIGSDFSKICSSSHIQSMQAQFISLDMTVFQLITQVLEPHLIMTHVAFMSPTMLCHNKPCLHLNIGTAGALHINIQSMLLTHR